MKNTVPQIKVATYALIDVWKMYTIIRVTFTIGYFHVELVCSKLFLSSYVRNYTACMRVGPKGMLRNNSDQLRNSMSLENEKM